MYVNWEIDRCDACLMEFGRGECIHGFIEPEFGGLYFGKDLCPKCAEGLNVTNCGYCGGVFSTDIVNAASDYKCVNCRVGIVIPNLEQTP